MAIRQWLRLLKKLRKEKTMSNLKLFNLTFDVLVGLFVITGLFVCVGVEHKKIQGNIAYQIINKIDKIFSRLILMIFAIYVLIWLAISVIVAVKIKWLSWIVPIGIYLRHIILSGIITKITTGELVGMLVWSVLALFWISSLCVKWWLRKHGYARSNNDQERKD